MAQGRSGRLSDVALVGFDSAWADNPRKPGAICALTIDLTGACRFQPPILTGFNEADAFVETLRPSARKLLIAIDQPTIVTNQIWHAAVRKGCGVRHELERWWHPASLSR